MVHLPGLQIQLENLKILFEDELLKDADIQKIKNVYSQIAGLEKMIAEQKLTIKLDYHE